MKTKLRTRHLRFTANSWQASSAKWPQHVKPPRPQDKPANTRKTIANFNLSGQVAFETCICNLNIDAHTNEVDTWAPITQSWCSGFLPHVHSSQKGSTPTILVHERHSTLHCILTVLQGRCAIALPTQMVNATSMQPIRNSGIQKLVLTSVGASSPYRVVPVQVGYLPGSYDVCWTIVGAPVTILEYATENLLMGVPTNCVMSLFDALGWTTPGRLEQRLGMIIAAFGDKWKWTQSKRSDVMAKARNAKVKAIIDVGKYDQGGDVPLSDFDCD